MFQSQICINNIGSIITFEILFAFELSVS